MTLEELAPAICMDGTVIVSTVDDDGFEVRRHFYGELSDMRAFVDSHPDVAALQVGYIAPDFANYVLGINLWE